MVILKISPATVSEQTKISQPCQMVTGLDNGVTSARLEWPLRRPYAESLPPLGWWIDCVSGPMR